MKKGIQTAVVCRKTDAAAVKADVLAVGVFEKEPLGSLLRRLDGLLKGAVSEVRNLKDFKGKTQTTALLYTGGRIGAARLLLTGMGEKKKANLDTFRKTAAAAASVGAT